MVVELLLEEELERHTVLRRVEEVVLLDQVVAMLEALAAQQPLGVQPKRVQTVLGAGRPQEYTRDDAH